MSEETIDEEDEDEDEEDEDDPYDSAEEEEVAWTRYEDPDSHRIFWAKPDAWEGGGDAAFWEDGDDLWQYHVDPSDAGEDYWAHVDNVNLWFYVRSGTQKLSTAGELA